MAAQVCTLARASAVIIFVLSASPAHAQPDEAAGHEPPREGPSRLQVLLAVEAGMHAADMFSTVRNLQMGGGNVREANPLLAPFAHRPAALVAVSSGVNLLQMYTISKIRPRHPKLAMVWTVALIGVETFAVTNNIRVAGQLQRIRR